MKPIAVADCETDPFKRDRIPDPFIWGYYDGQNYEQFYSTMDFVRYVIDKKVVLYAHNGGKFDWHFILDYIEPFTKVRIINGRIAKFYIGECEFRDSYNILPTALSAFKKDEVDYSIFEKGERDKPHNKKIIEDYLYSDCYYLYDYVTQFIERYGFCLTQAGAAMRQWEQLSGESSPKDTGGEIYESFKRFYYGGRCQSFYYGELHGDFDMVDINSAYPYAMLSPHPYGIEYCELSYRDFLALDDNEKGSCFIDLNCISFGALPYRGKDNSLYFPDDFVNRRYSITGWEYLAGHDTETIIDESDHVIYYFFDRRNFSVYINHFYEERLKAIESGNKALNIFCKLLMNSLYGKFGSNPDDYYNYMVLDHYHFDEDGIAIDTQGILHQFNGDFGSMALGVSDLDDAQKRYYNVATAASITGYVRAFMWCALSNCEGLLYCDTDSIAAQKIGDLPNGYGKALGQWGIDGKFSWGAFCGRKLYAMRHRDKPDEKRQWNLRASELRQEDNPHFKLACKGVNVTANEIKKVANGEEIIFYPEVPVFSVHKAPHFTERTIRMNKKALQND